MKKIIAIAVVGPLMLTSCFFDKTEPTVNTQGSSSGTQSNVSSGNLSEDASNISSVKKDVVSKGDTVSVDYVGTLEDGTVFDSSLEEFAKKVKGYTPGARKYEPLTFTVGAGQMIKGFDAWVVGMKLGEKKTLTIAPKDAYGEAYTEQDVAAKYFQDIFTETVPRDNFKDTVTQVVPLSALGDKAKGLTVGQIIEAGSTKAKVTKIEGENVTVDIENSQNPFYQKKLAVGLKSTFEGNTITVKALTDTGVTVEVVNKANPFYGKKIKEGMEGSTPNGGKIKILKITADTITIGVPNTHELAGKTLKFDVEIKAIK